MGEGGCSKERGEAKVSDWGEDVVRDPGRGVQKKKKSQPGSIPMKLSFSRTFLSAFLGKSLTLQERDACVVRLRDERGERIIGWRERKCSGSVSSGIQAKREPCLTPKRRVRRE